MALLWSKVNSLTWIYMLSGLIFTISIIISFTFSYKHYNLNSAHIIIFIFYIIKLCLVLIGIIKHFYILQLIRFGNFDTWYYPECLAKKISSIDHSNATYQPYINWCTRYGLPFYLIFHIIFLFLLHYYVYIYTIPLIFEYLQLLTVLYVLIYRKYKGDTYFFNYYDWGVARIRSEVVIKAVIDNNAKNKKTNDFSSKNGKTKSTANQSNNSEDP
eukprot:489445_1